MFTLEKNSFPNPENVKDAIDYNETLRADYNKMDNYYNGEHDIVSRRKSDLFKNNIVIVNHARYITQINVGYMLGNEVEYQSENDIELVTKAYRNQTISLIDVKLAVAASKFGKAYERVYLDGNNPISTVLDPRNCVIAYDDTVKHSVLFVVLYEKTEKPAGYKNITVYTENNQIEFTYKQKFIMGDNTDNPLGSIPVIEYVNNDSECGDYKPVIPSIDAYNLLQSDRLNDKQQLVESIMTMKGYDLTEELREDLIENRTLSNLPVDSETAYLSKTLNEAEVDILRKVIEADIHKISMTPNLSDENFVGNSSGVAIKYKLLPFEQNIVNKVRFFEMGLRKRFEIYNKYLSNLKNQEVVEASDIEIVFKRNLPQNDLETSQIIANLSGKVSDETLIGQLSFISDAAKEIETAQKESLDRANLESPQFGTGLPDQGNQNNLNINQDDTGNI